MISMFLLAGCLLGVEEGSHMAAMAKYGQTHCGDESRTPGSCRIQGRWNIWSDSGEVGISTFPTPITEGDTDQVLDLYMIEDGDGEFRNGYNARRIPFPQKADPAMAELAKLLQDQGCHERRIGASYATQLEGRLKPSPCIPIFGEDGTIQVVILED